MKAEGKSLIQGKDGETIARLLLKNKYFGIKIIFILLYIFYFALLDSLLRLIDEGIKMAAGPTDLPQYIQLSCNFRQGRTLSLSSDIYRIRMQCRVCDGLRALGGLER